MEMIAVNVVIYRPEINVTLFILFVMSEPFFFFKYVFQN